MSGKASTSIGIGAAVLLELEELELDELEEVWSEAFRLDIGSHSAGALRLDVGLAENRE